MLPRMTSLLLLNTVALTVLVAGVSFLSDYLAGGSSGLATLLASLPIGSGEIWSDGVDIYANSFLRLVQSATTVVNS